MGQLISNVVLNVNNFGFYAFRNHIFNKEFFRIVSSRNEYGIYPSSHSESKTYHNLTLIRESLGKILNALPSPSVFSGKNLVRSVSSLAYVSVLWFFSEKLAR